MHVFLILAVVGSAVAAPQYPTTRFAAPRPTFDHTVTNFAPPVSNFGTPVAPIPRFATPTNSFAPTVIQFGAPVAPAPRFAAPTTNFGTPAVTGRGNSVYNLDSPAFVSSAGGFDQTRQQPVSTLVERSQYQNDNGEYGNSHKNSDGSHFTETGSLIPTNDNLDFAVAKKGSFGYISPEGVPVSLTYTADQYGFHPEGDILPKNVAPLAPVFV